MSALEIELLRKRVAMLQTQRDFWHEKCDEARAERDECRELLRRSLAMTDEVAAQNRAFIDELRDELSKITR